MDDQDFKVVDRRKTRDDSVGEAKPAETKAAEAKAVETKAAEAKGAGADAGSAGDGKAERVPEEPMVPADFTTLVISLATGALLSLGEIPDPDGGQPRVSKTMAQYNIDTLVVLQQKTKGNLTSDEGKILDRFIYDLRMKFVSKFGGTWRGLY